MGLADRVRTRLAQPESPYLPRDDQLLNRPGHVLDGDVRVHPVLIQQVDVVRPQPLERLVHDLLDLLRPAIQAFAQFAVLDVEPELGADQDVLPHGGQGLADQLFVGVRAVNLGRVEERHSQFHRPAKQPDHGLLVRNEAAVVVHPHAAESQARYFQAVLPGSERAAVHPLRGGRLGVPRLRGPQERRHEERGPHGSAGGQEVAAAVVTRRVRLRHGLTWWLEWMMVVDTGLRVPAPISSPLPSELNGMNPMPSSFSLSSNSCSDSRLRRVRASAAERLS